MAGLLFLSTMHAAAAGQIESLTWLADSAQPVLQIRVSGDAAYRTEALENGQRLRLTFPQSGMAPTLTELDGQGLVKGVYPYIAENGTAVNVDLLMSQSGQLDVQKSAEGYRVTALTGSTGAPAPLASVAAKVEPAAAVVPEKVVADTANGRNTIEEIVYAKLPGDRIQVTLKMSQPPVEPNAFSITNPARVSLDFPNTRAGLAKKSVPVKEGAVTSVTAVEAEGRTRVVLSLIKSVAYSTSIEGKNFVVTVAAPASAIAGTEQPKTTHFASTRKVGKYSLKNIDFRRGAQGDGKIIITLSDPTVGIDIREQAGEIILDFQNTSVPAELQRRLDVVDFATPVQNVDTYAQGKNTRMVVIPKGKYEHVAYQAGNIFTVSVKPVIERADEKKVDEFGYSGEKLSLNFQNIEVRAALQVLADFTGFNFVVSDTVRGSLTLRLKDVPWDQALDIIVDAKNLAVRRKGNVVTVAPAAEVAAKEKSALEANKAVVELEPLISELIQINYAKADDIANLLKSIKAITTTAGAHPVFSQAVAITKESTDSNTLLSPRGQVTVDARTNSLLIQDTAGKIREVRKLIAKLDQPVRQVIIETRLVEATNNFARSLGVRLGHITDKTNNGDRRLTTGQDATLDNTFFTTNVYDINKHYNVNLPSPGIGSSAPGVFTLMFRQAGGLVDLELSALEQQGNGKIISSPRVITANQKRASIEQGQERVFTTSVLGVGSVVTKKATLKLEVTPQITPDDRINLDVDITKDNFADAASGLLNVKQIKTQVLLDNGETVVIGGIYEQDKADTITKVPFLGDLPLLGWLFKSKEAKDNKTELLIFLTPKILSEKVSLR
jgi:type IV pilus assembly protein PilQ